MRPRGMAKFLATAVTLALMATMAACASSNSASKEPEAPAQKPRYTQLFDSGKFAEAQAAAATAAKTAATTEDREQAMLIAGLSAHARDRSYEAVPYLTPLLDSDDEAIVGKAEATLGLIALQKGQNDQAAEYLSAASEKLTGDNAARAALYAGDALRAAGKQDEAQAQYEKAQSLARVDSVMKATIEDRLKGGPAVKPAAGKKSGTYSIQLGAFTNQQRAQAAADRVRSKAQSLSLGSPRLIESSSKGKKVVLVQVGKFGTKQAAESAKVKLGQQAFVTASAD